MPEFGMAPAASATDIPLSRIQELKRQGLTNNEIIVRLQQAGFTSTQVFDALSQAAVAPTGPPAALNISPAGRSRMDPSQPSLFSSGQPMPPPPSSGMFNDPGETEELIEAIIDEKWNDLLGDINKVISWKDATESRITRLEQSLTDLRSEFDKLHQAVIGKVGEYDQHILDVGAEVKAMEKVFSKVLPVFTDNVAELSRVAEQMKARK
jgi:hypothetical protein